MDLTAATTSDAKTDLTSEPHAAYTEQEHKALIQSYEATLVTMQEAEVVKGTVVAMSERDVVININAKADGLVPLNEFRDLPHLKIGDEVDVYIEKQEDAKGQLIVSRKKAKVVKGWESIQVAADSKESITCVVKRRTKGGLIVDAYGIEAFLPGSQIDVKPVRDFDAYLDKKIDVVVLKINHANENVVVSHKALVEKSLEDQKSAIIGNLQKGQILEGIIKNMTSFGVFIDLGGVDGLLHITDISWTRIRHPEEVLTLGQKVEVVVTDFDEDQKRISLGMKQLTPHPWEALPETIEVGTKVKGKVVNIADYGAFLEIMPGIEGLLHISEMSWTQHPRTNIRDMIQIGDVIEAVVLTLDREEKKMSLSIKQLQSDPWTHPDLLERYAVGTKHQGVVKNLTHFGAFIELEEGIEGLLHVSDLSWTQKINHPSELLKLGDTIETIIIEISPDNKKIALGYKQLTENPWDTYASEFQVNTVHQGTVTQKIEKGILVTLVHDLEGFVPKRYLAQTDEQETAIGNQLNLRVIEFSSAHHKIVLAPVDTVVDGAPSVTKPGTDRYIKFAHHAITKTASKSTLGDLEALVNLKKQTETDTSDTE